MEPDAKIATGKIEKKSGKPTEGCHPEPEEIFVLERVGKSGW